MSGESGGRRQESPAREEAPDLDTEHAHPARVYNYWLGGKDNFAADREAAEHAISANPGIVADVRANRAFLVRTVRHLTTECGIRQFLDIGTGLPTASNTHEVAQTAAPDARIVYVDNDPVVLSHAQALLSSTAEGATAYLEADLRDTAGILRAATRTLDFSEPVALMLLIILHLIPDTDDPYGIMAALMRALPSGSYLVLSHPASDIRAAQMAEMTRRVNERLSGPKATMRDRAAITRFFDGLELLEPGVVQPQQWRREAGVLSPDRVTAWCGVARKGLPSARPLPGARQAKERPKPRCECSSATPVPSRCHTDRRLFRTPSSLAHHIW
jgi:S-adenosyl methyltransferase